MQTPQIQLPTSTQTNTYYTSVLWVMWYAPQKEFLKNSSVVDFCVKRYLIGARYYDGDLGLWTSVDPARQFWSPYGYGLNPINGIDPNGMYFEDGSNAMAEYEAARDNDFYGSVALEADLTEMYNSFTLFDLEYGDVAHSYYDSENDVHYITIPLGLSDFETARVFRHEGDHGIQFSWEKELISKGINPTPTTWHNRVPEITDKSFSGNRMNFMKWNASLPWGKISSETGSTNRRDGIYYRDKTVYDQYNSAH